MTHYITAIVPQGEAEYIHAWDSADREELVKLNAELFQRSPKPPKAVKIVESFSAGQSDIDKAIAALNRKH